ncbi:PucR family transcriptional regulator [Amycolatopsis sp. CA-230715]|uniref:PucR family transcriptional regulator n=1 Tax=Amycolatopsis sp. CA-230715 TaxID=2745196 RepID=UPI001C01D379|nr:helix-turn-helix domain-containing protein [Amycolatopsis sp. CA-230715]QWF85385.1 hypothetical protein HUW46_08839 [Amycolatopsis sp. CA-230715]
MPVTPRSSPPTVADLHSGGPLSGADLVTETGLDNAVSEIRIIDDLTDLAHVAPGSAVVLTTAAARGEWTVETALRQSWERAAACVISPASAVTTAAPALVSERLKIPLITTTADPYTVALSLARVINDPAAARADLIAQCVAALDDQPLRAQAVLAALHSAIPGAQFALVSANGVLAGRPAVQQAIQAAEPGTGGRLIRRALPQHAAPGTELAALLAPRSAGLAATVQSVLGIATPILAAALLTERLGAERDARLAERILHQLLDAAAHPTPTDLELLNRAAAYHWVLHGPLLPVALRTVDHPPPPDLPATLPSAWHAAGATALLARRGDGWVTWWPVPTGDAPRSTAHHDRVRTLLDAVRPTAALVAGIGPVVDGLAQLRYGLDRAASAAAFARHSGPGHVETVTTIGPSVLLAALPVDILTPAAHRVLTRLVDHDPDRTLLRTLAKLLDTAGSISATADQLGVHRNTVTSRARRLTALGLDPEHLDDRLAIHLACHLLLHRHATAQ